MTCCSLEKSCLLTDPVYPNSEWVSLFLQIYKKLSFPSRQSYGVEILRECSSPTPGCMSQVMCHLSHVTSHVTCHMSQFFYFSSSVSWTNVETSQWKVCYQQSLPNQVFHQPWGNFYLSVIRMSLSKHRCCFKDNWWWAGYVFAGHILRVLRLAAPMDSLFVPIVFLQISLNLLE